ncbi:MAG TPA: Glu-tRNA(Gln) amidotransferase subunit GatD [Thermoplasmata archaeon]|nr:Glu-tRNA(Gln) amidotransferase subunit GatD [Thermoplasmata archaeon]
MAERDVNSDPWATLRSLPMGERIAIESADGRRWSGTLVPSHELSGDRTIQLKLDSGYNVGIRIGPHDVVRRISASSGGPEPTEGDKPPRAPEEQSKGRRISLLTTGGTIASRVDYHTGGVRPVKTEQEVLGFFPDLGREGPVELVPVSDRLSEEIAPPDWVELAHKVVEAFSGGSQGVVIAHGTDTLAFSAAALSFLLEDLPGPVVLVGAQRSPDRPSSDAFTNLAQAARLARFPGLGEVVVLMHDGLSDDRFAIHRGTRVRKMHSTRRDAFRTRDGPPLGLIEGDVISFRAAFRPAGAGPARVTGPLDPNAAILWYHPGLEPERAAAFARGLRGVVVAGTGLGHVSLTHLPWIREAIRGGAVVVMTTQCLEGSSDPFVYSTGRELLRAGVLYAGDLLPETAFVKLLWALGRSKDPQEVRRLMLEPRAGEFEARHLGFDRA